MRIQKNFIEVTHKRAMLTYDHNELYLLMIKIFEQIHSFSRTQDILYQTALEEYHKRQASMEDCEDYSQVIPREASKQLNQIGLHYRANFDQFNEALSKFEVDEKSLSFRLDFNEYYRESKERENYGDMSQGNGFDQLDVDHIDDGEDEEDEEEEEEDEEEQINTHNYRPSHGRPGSQGY